MAAQNQFQIDISATDTATPVIERVKALTEQYSRTLQSAGGIVDQYGRSVTGASQQVQTFNNVAATQAERAGKVEREFNKLTDASEFLGSGIKKVRNIMEGILWGTVIGAVAGVVNKLLEMVLQTDKLKTSSEDLIKTVTDQAIAWKLLEPSLNAATHASVGLYNAQLNLLKLQAHTEINKLQESLNGLVNKNREAREGIETLEALLRVKLAPSWIEETKRQLERLKLEVAENDVGIEKYSAEIQHWIEIAKLQPTTIGQVNKAMDDYAISLKKAVSVQETIGRQILDEAQRIQRDRAAVQEQMGRDIVAFAQLELRDAENTAKERGAIQESMGRSIVAAAKLDLAEEANVARERGLVQETLGRMIVLTALMELAEEDRIGKERAAIQEAIAKQIVDIAQAEWRDKSAVQEEFGREILVQAQKEWRDRVAIQEQMGRDIVAAEQRTQRDRANVQEVIGRQIQQQAVKEYNDKLILEQLKLDALQNGFRAAASLADAMNTFAQGKSRALFNLAKAAGISSAIVDTYVAATKALAGPPGPPWTYAIAAATIAAGLANVARIQSTQFGSSSAGGGGAPSFPSGSTDTSTPRFAPISDSAKQPLPLNVTIIIQGNLVGNEEFVNNEIIPAIEDAVRNERSKLAMRR